MCEYNEDLYGPRECPDNLIQVDYEKLEELILNRSREMVCFTGLVLGRPRRTKPWKLMPRWLAVVVSRRVRLLGTSHPI